MARCETGSRWGCASGRRPSRCPSSRRRRPALRGRRADELPILEHVALPLEPVGRPREHRRVAAAAARRRTSMLTCTKRRPSRRDRLTRVTSAPGASKSARTRSRSTRACGSTGRSAPRSATSDGDRRVDVHRRRAVERQVELFLVLVLRASSDAAAARRHQRARERRDSDEQQRGTSRSRHRTAMIS